MTPKPDSRLPWRAVKSVDGTGWIVWDTQQWTIADHVPSEDVAQLIAQAPTLQSRVQSLTDAKDRALAILEKLWATPDEEGLWPFNAIAQAIEVLKRS